MIFRRFSRSAICGILCAILCASASAQETAAGAAIVVRDAARATLAHSGEIASLGAWRVPPAAQLVFDVRGTIKGFNYSTTGQLAWVPKFANDQNPTSGEVSAHTYEARLQVQIPLLGARTQTSEGRIAAGGLQPLVFTDRSRREDFTTFEPARAQLRFSRNGQTQAMAALTQDRVSVFFQLAGLFNADAQRWTRPGTTLTLAAASRSSVQPWTFRVAGLQQLELPAGRITALMVEHSRAGDTAAPVAASEAGIGRAIWFAPELGYLPVRIRLLEDNGDTVDLRLQSFDAAQP